MAKPPSIPLLDSKFVPLLGARPPLARARLACPPGLLAGECSVVTVVAPAGYGKTTLLAQWHALSPEGQRAWLNLDDNDNDPVRLLRYLIAALQMADRALGREAQAQLQVPILASPVAALEALATDLASRAERLLLFLDDAQVLTEPAATQILDWLLQYAPRQLRIVLGSRQAPPLALSGLRLRARLIEFDHTHLAFTADEAGRFCRERTARPLDRAALQRLMDKTEGWPAAVELAMLAMHGAADATTFLDDFCGSERGIVDYLGEAVFGRLTPELRLRIDQLAQFDRFSASLAQAVTGDATAGDTIAELLRRRLFLLALDRTGQWFRFHHLVCDYLRRNPPPIAAPRCEPAAAGFTSSRWSRTPSSAPSAPRTGNSRAGGWPSPPRTRLSARAPMPRSFAGSGRFPPRGSIASRRSASAMLFR